MDNIGIAIKILQKIASISNKRLHTDDDMAAIYARSGEAISALLMDDRNKHSLTPRFDAGYDSKNNKVTFVVGPSTKTSGNRDIDIDDGA